MQCGKTTVLDWLTRLVHRKLPASNVSGPVIYRAIEAWKPTLLIDEVDTFLDKNDELRGILNSGHTRATAFVLRSEGDNFEPKSFSTWSAKALALIGRLPGTLHDRSIVLGLRRKLPSEKIEKLRHAPPELFESLIRRCVRFARDNAQVVRAARPEIPAELNDRAGDNWEPLMAIADVAGGEWPKLARDAARARSKAEENAASVNLELLADIREVFKADRIHSAELVQLLTASEEKPWATFNRGKPISTTQLSRRLRAFGILSRSMRAGEENRKGYYREDFEDAFGRYLPSLGQPSGIEASQRHNPVSMRVSGDIQNVTAPPLCRIEETPGAAPALVCDGVTDENPQPRETERFSV